MSTSGARGSADAPLWTHQVPGGTHWSGLLSRGTTLRLTDLEGGTNAAMILYNADDRTERYNMADTLKAQHTARLTAGHACYSDMGRVLCSLTADTLGWHDPLGGVSSAELVRSRYGEQRFAVARNQMYRNGYDSLLLELAKWGLSARDLVANINFFSKTSVDATGALQFHPQHSYAGSRVDIRCEMNLLVVLSTAPHPLDPSPVYAPKPLGLTAWYSGPAGAEDACRNACPENQRGFCNTDRLFREE